MNCTEVELLLVTSEALPPQAREHLASCEKCREFEQSSAQLLAAAALPAPSVEEKASLGTLAPRVLQQWSRGQRRRSFARRVVGLAVAACVGAAVASAALLPKLQQQPLPSSGDLPEFAVSTEPELVSSDTEDELEAFEVSWPSP